MGYKQTEIGAIPDEWDAAPLGDHASFRTGPFGSSLHKSDYVRGGVPIINPMHIVDGKLLPDEDTSVSVTTQLKLSSFAMEPGDVVIGRRGDMGRCAVVGDHQRGWLCGTGSMIIRPRDTSPHFLQRVLSDPRAIRAIENAAVGTTMVNLNQEVLANLALPFPDIAEQHAIANALSDVDALLDALDRQIARQRDLKQAAMQRLLTGRTRLPGFLDSWQKRVLGDHLSFLKHGSYPRADLTSEGCTKYLHYGDIHASPWTILNVQTASMPYLPESKARLLSRLQDGDLIFVDASEDLEGVGKSVELSGVAEGEVVSGLHTIAARFDKNILADGFKAYLQHIPAFRNHLRALAAGTKVYATNRRHIASARLILPSVEEQSAIAQVLSDMDAEISALEARRAKTAAIKQGMMQELLTGRTRLV